MYSFQFQEVSFSVHSVAVQTSTLQHLLVHSMSKSKSPGKMIIQHLFEGMPAPTSNCNGS